MKLNKLIIFGILILMLISCMIGFLAGKIISVPGVTCAKEINPLHAISILTSIFIAIFIAILLDKHKENNKIQRELIFNWIEDLSGQVKQIDSIISDEKIHLNAVVSSIKKMRMSFEFIKRITRTLKIDTKNFEMHFEKNHKDLNILATYTPIKPTVDETSPIKCAKGVLRYNHDRLLHIETAIQSLKNTIFELQVMIASQ